MKTNTFPSPEELNQVLLDRFNTWIQEAVSLHGSAHILLSGGSTPMGFYKLLATCNLPWHLILIGLVDERYVDQNSAYSNEKMVRSAMSRLGEQLQLVPMVVDPLDIDRNLKQINGLYDPFFKRIDICLLGMGTDGHTASIFPGDSTSERLMVSDEIGIYNTVSPQIPNNRLTCSPKLLSQTRHGAVLIHGEEKSRIFKEDRRVMLPIDQFRKASNFEHFISRL